MLLTKSCVVCYQCCWLSRVLFFTSLLLAKSWVVCCLLPMFCWLNRVLLVNSVLLVKPCVV